MSTDKNPTAPIQAGRPSAAAYGMHQRRPIPRAGVPRRGWVAGLAFLLVGLGGPQLAGAQSPEDRIGSRGPSSSSSSARPSGGSRGSGVSTSSTRGTSRGGNRGNVRSGHVRNGGNGRMHDGSRRHRDRYRYRSGYRYRSHYYSPWGFGLGYPFSWYWGSYGYGPSYQYGYGYPGSYGNSDGYYRSAAGALDLDIKPEEAEIYVDGNLVGIADNYDGFPRYLWLEQGTHNVVIYHEGYETLGKQIKLSPGVVVRLKDQMVRGTAKPASEMYAQLGPVPKAAERVRTRDRDDAPLAPWRYEEKADREPQRPAARRAPARRSEDAWRERGGAARGGAGSGSSRTAVELDQRSAAAGISFAVEPADAVIYLDGRLLGSAADLAAAGEAVLVDPGSHVIEISRPGYATSTRKVTVASGKTETVQIELSAEDN